MGSDKLRIQKYKPSVPKRYLLLVAAFVWTIAGGMLLYRGLSILGFNSSRIVLKETAAFLAGIVFYRFMFAAISFKHIQRILNLPTERPCVFSFFNRRSYLLMVIMIGGGITLRLSGIVPIAYLALFYIAMGTPLFISALRFYRYAIRNIRQYRQRTPTV